MFCKPFCLVSLSVLPAILQSRTLAGLFELTRFSSGIVVIQLHLQAWDAWRRGPRPPSRTADAIFDSVIVYLLIQNWEGGAPFSP